MVRSEGDTRVMEQLGEKQDLEAALSRLGFRHEDFVVTVRRAQPKAAGAWACHYAVRIANRETAKSHIYWGGLSENWVAFFARDLAAGLFGPFADPKAVCGQAATRPEAPIGRSDGSRPTR